MKPTFLIVFSFLATTVCLSQQTDDRNRSNIWLFGYGSFGSLQYGGSVIDFNKNTPEIYREDRPMELDFTFSSICDKNGELIFYTNNIYIANALHQQMVNGDSINPGVWTTTYEDTGMPIPQGSIVLPLPYAPDKYVLVHALLDILPWIGPHHSSIYYSVIDLELDNGLGAVIDKNIEVLSDTTVLGMITATRHGNGRDWWILVPEHNTNKYYRLLLSPEGIENMGYQIVGDSVVQGLGQAVFSPDGTKYIRCDGVSIAEGDYLNFYDFDRCTGLLNNQLELHIHDSLGVHGVAVSPNSRFAYFSALRYVYQFDLWEDDIAASKDTVAIWDGGVSPSPFPSTFFLCQLGPDGKIYINTPSGSNVLNIIHSPDIKGIDCNLEQRGVQLPTHNAFTMPNFPYYRLGPLDESPCDSLGIDNTPVSDFRYGQDSMDYLTVQLRDLSYHEPDEWFWDFGDNTTSQDTSPVHTFMQDGTYEVCLTVSNEYGEDTFCRTLQLGTVSIGEELTDLDINVFPNPCKEGVNIIIIDNLPQDAQVIFYDAVGQRKRSQSLQKGWNTIFLDNLQSGLYFYQIEAEEKIFQSGKLVKI